MGESQDIPTYRRRHSHLSPTTFPPIADDIPTYRRRHSHLSPTTFPPIDRISDGNTWFKRPRNQGSNQVSNQVYNQAINQGEPRIYRKIYLFYFLFAELFSLLYTPFLLYGLLSTPLKLFANIPITDIPFI